MFSDQQNIELFHLLFLRDLKNNLDSSLYAIKGGCNLRFFFESIRYSEDLDIDVSIISQATLKKKIDNILTRTPLQQGLSVYGLEIAQVSSPKQTQTVQRWKVGIKHKERALILPTKIEFSRREIESERRAEPLNQFVLQSYRLPQMILPHYLYAAAVSQKIRALIHRTETQGRDVFDLHLLFSKKELAGLSIEFDLEKATENILGISYHDFSSQVVSYLLPDYIDYYRSPEIWSKLQLNVINHLELIKNYEAP